MMKWWLFLDDERYPLPPGHWIVVRNVDDAMWYIKEWGPPLYMSLDHDLGYGKMTGMDFCREFVNWIMDNNVSLPDTFGFYIHSQNPVGAKNMISYLDQFLKDGI